MTLPAPFLWLVEAWVATFGLVGLAVLVCLVTAALHRAKGIVGRILRPDTAHRTPG